MNALALDPHAYHIDLRDKVTKVGPEPGAAAAALGVLTSDPLRANPVSILQLGLGALQLGNEGQLPLVAETVAWVERTVDERGLIAYRFPMPHTFPLDPPWYSALAQGEAVSLLLRAAQALDRPGLVELAERVAAPLLDPTAGLVATTPDGPVLQEYPTDPPAHVLNGWLLALWGLYDLAQVPSAAARPAAEAFAAGAQALGGRIDRYRTAAGWSLYDLYPHPLPNVASFYYHRLHVAQVRHQTELAPDPRLRAVAEEWGRAAGAPAARSVSLARKLAFRTVRPRWHRVRFSDRNR
ncbi:MAG: D-glucuronyl C5-epimerase family protein [Gaiellaceae bacterium]